MERVEIKAQDLKELVNDLEAKKVKMEKYPGYVEDLPSAYVGAAVYSYVIKELKGLIKGE